MSEGSRRTVEGRFADRYAGRMLAVTALSWGTLQTARFVLPPLLPEIRADLGLTLAQTGVILTALQATYGLSQYPGGRLSDSWTRSTLIIPGVIVIAFGCFLIGSATGFLFLLFGTIVFGVGKGLFAIPSRALISDLFVEHRGRALGTFGAAGDIGGAVASGLAVVALSYASWRTAFAPLAVVLFCLAALFAVWTREPYVVHGANLEIFGTVRRVISTPEQRWTLTAYTLFYIMTNGVLAFLPAYLRDTKGFSPELASASFAILFVVGISVKPMMGAISDRVPRLFIAIAGMTLGAVALGALLAVESVLAVVLAIVLFAVGYKGQLPVIDAILMDDAPEEKMGSDLGAARTLFLGVGGLGPAVVGVVTDVYGYTVAFAVLVGCLVAAIVILTARIRR